MIYYHNLLLILVNVNKIILLNVKINLHNKKLDQLLMLLSICRKVDLRKLGTQWLVA
jgi:hypothetical protein